MPTPPIKPEILCWGASARWAAEFLCGDFDVTTVDLFADRDTRQTARRSIQVERLAEIVSLWQRRGSTLPSLILPLGGTENLWDELDFLRGHLSVGSQRYVGLGRQERRHGYGRTNNKHRAAVDMGLVPNRNASM